MKLGISRLMQLVTDQMSDPRWPYRLAFWTMIVGAAWLILRGSNKSSKSN